MAALARVMASRGYAGATVVEIARTAGLAPGLVHYHFADKHEILLELCSEVAATIQQRYQARMSDTSTPRERLSAFIDAHVVIGKDADADAVAAWSAVAAEAMRDPAVRVVYRRHIEREMSELGRLLTDALREQGRRLKDVAGKAAVILAAIEGAFRIATSAPGATPRGFAARGIKQVAAALIAAEPKVRGRA